ncbi:MAG TPA: hypothetical protein VEQ59_03290 [Polyangiaceae bacterium]|nr:hypothetical protein [Polyangiaceae bacterium]
MERADVQGIVLFAYKQQPRSRFFLLKFGGGQPREWLRRTLTEVTSAEEAPDVEYRFNVAFSARGLQALGIDAEDLTTFQREFVQGMAHPERSNVLGDRYSDDPRHWQWGSGDEQVDALVMLYARSTEELEARGRAREIARQVRHQRAPRRRRPRRRRPRAFRLHRRLGAALHSRQRPQAAPR